MTIFFIPLMVLILPVPVFHLILHAALPAWRRKPALLYATWIAIWFLLGVGALLSRQILTIQFLAPPAPFKFIGGLFAVSGSFLILWSMRSLGVKKFFVWAVVKPEAVDQRAVTSGPYRFFRHPAYVGYRMLAVGAFLMTGWWSYLFIAAWLFATIPTVIRLEEREFAKRLMKFRR